jgi:hypothetical protein
LVHFIVPQMRRIRLRPAESTCYCHQGKGLERAVYDIVAEIAAAGFRKGTERLYSASRTYEIDQGSVDSEQATATAEQGIRAQTKRL